jgi:excisionase family DNA binding protein
LKKSFIEKLYAPSPLFWHPMTRNAEVDQPADEPFLLTVKEAAKRLAISERTLFAMTSSGEIPCVRIGRLVRFAVETLKKWIKDHESTDHEPMPRRSRPESKPQPRPESKPTLRKRNVPQVEVSRPVPAAPRRAGHNTRRDSKPEERADPFSRLLKGLGIDPATLPPMTNGDIMRIARVDQVQCHGWQHLGRTLPDEALERLRDYVKRTAGAR